MLRSAGIHTITYYEDRDFRGVRIVNSTSTHPGVGPDPVASEDDHLSIVKPRERGAQVCLAARSLLRSFVLGSSSPSAAVSPVRGATAPSIEVTVQVAQPAPAICSRIPHDLPAAAKEFFGRSAELTDLIERLKAAQNTAVVGPAGLGKTALAAKALRAVVGDDATSLAASPYPDGVVYLDLYGFHGEADPAWNALEGPSFHERASPRNRATEACRNRCILVVFEGAEEAHGERGRPSVSDILSVLSQPNRWLLLTRLSVQASAADTVSVKESLSAPDDGALLDFLTKGQLTPAVRASALQLLQGHPLALTWAANLLARDDEDPELLVHDWTAADLPELSDPREGRRTLRWLFDRSVRDLDADAEVILSAASLLGPTPFPLDAMTAAIGPAASDDETRARASLRSLVQRNLLRRVGQAGAWQFPHVLACQFARKESGNDPALRQRLAQWLHGRISSATRPGATEAELAELPSLLDHLAALLRADDDQQLWRPLADAALYDFAIGSQL